MNGEDSADNGYEKDAVGAEEFDESLGVGELLPEGSEGKEHGELDSLHLYLRQVRRRRRLSADGAKRCCSAMRRAEAAMRDEAEPESGAFGVFCACRRRLIEGNLGLVVAIARGYRRFGVPLEDLIQEGNIGLLYAVHGFDPDAGTRFPSYAVPWIRQGICRALSAKSRTIHIPVQELDLRRQAESVLSELDQQAHNRSCSSGHYRKPTVEDCAREIGIPKDRLRTNLRRLPDMESLDAPLAASRTTLLSTIPDTGQPSPLDSAATGERRSCLRAAVSHLPDRLQQVTRRHYGFDGGSAASFAEIGRDLHLSRERVRQLHNSALALLRRDGAARVAAD